MVGRGNVAHSCFGGGSIDPERWISGDIDNGMIEDTESGQVRVYVSVKAGTK